MASAQHPSFLSAESTALQQWFSLVDTDRSGTINAAELQRALAQGNLNFSLKMVTSIMRIFDSDKSSALSFPQFCSMQAFLQKVHQAFSTHSGGQSQLTLPQMQAALAQLGFALDMQPDGAFYKLCQSCECPNPTRHSTPRAAPGAPCCTVHATPPPSCTRPAWPSYTPCRPASPVDDFEKRGAFGLDAFMAMAVTLTNAKAIYGLFDPQNTGKVTMDFNQFVWSIAQL